MKSASSNSPQTRPPQERFQYIFGQLRAGLFPNGKTLARDLSVSAKTIHRDLDFMRDRLGLPIEYNALNYGYELTREVEALPGVVVSEDEMLALLVAQNTLAIYRDTPIYPRLESALRKLIVPLKDYVRMTPGAMEVSLTGSGSARHDPSLFQALFTALTDQRVLRFTYCKPHGAGPETRTVRPYHITLREAVWYLIAHDIDRVGIRTFALSRMSDPVVTRTVFDRPPDFSVSDYFRNSIGVSHGETVHRILLRFDAFAAVYVRERPLHAAQIVRELPDGGLEVTLELHDLIEAERLVLKWGGHVEALEPEVLRRRVAEAGRLLCAKHGQSAD